MKRKLPFNLALMIFMGILFPLTSFGTKHVINVQNFMFTPSSITDVVVGDTIRWVWVSGTHTTTSLTIPAGASAWDQPVTGSNTSYEYKVTVAGTYNYKCSIHFSMNMIGSFVASAFVPALSVLPANQGVTASAGSTSFSVTSNTGWTANSDQSWCSVTSAGTGNGTILATYGQNTSPSPRVANISVTVSGLAPVSVKVTQDAAPNKVLNLTLFLEALFNGTGMNKAQNGSGNQFPGTVADQVNVELHNSASPYLLVGGPYTVDLNVNGTASVSVLAALGASYYIVIKHRNSIETWSATGLSFSGAVITYDFSTAPGQAYGNNMKQLSGKYVLYAGDVNQDGIIDLGDMIPVDNAESSFTTGYVNSDINGDGLVDSSDMIVLDNNSALFVSKVVPNQ